MKHFKHLVVYSREVNEWTLGAFFIYPWIVSQYRKKGCLEIQVWTARDGYFVVDVVVVAVGKKKSLYAGFERTTLLIVLSNLIHYNKRRCTIECMEYLKYCICYFTKKKIQNFPGKKAEKFVILDFLFVILVSEIWQNKPKHLSFQACQSLDLNHSESMWNKL